MKQRMIDYYMDVAFRTAELSRAVKLKVGAVVVTVDDCVLYGWNGTVAGADNSCECILEDGSLKTLDTVLHAENNCLMKLAKSTLSGKGASLFQTHSPCMDCAKLIYQAGIVSVHYAIDYRCDRGIEFLNQCGITVTQQPRK